MLEQANSHKNAMGYSLFEPLNDGFKNSTKSAIEKFIPLNQGYQEVDHLIWKK